MGNASAPLPSQSLSARLGQWIDWRHAVALSAALDARPSPPATEDSPHAHGEDGEYARVRAVLVKAIEGDRVFALAASPPGATAAGETTGPEDAPPDYAFFRQRYVALQQVMEAEASHLRGRVRGMAARQAPSLQQLAAMDAVMERALGRHERALLSALPELLGKHFERLRHTAHDSPEGTSAARPATAWLDLFLKDMQRLLLAELDIRLQPAEGLLAALRNTPHG